MAKPVKGLKTLIRLARFNVDEKRRALTALQAREEEILDAIARAAERLKAEQKIAAKDSTGVGFLYGAYHQAWMDQRDRHHQTLTAVREQIEIARDELAEAFREQKTYEVTQANRDRQAQIEADHKEQAVLDELGLTIFRRKEKQAN